MRTPVATSWAARIVAKTLVLCAPVVMCVYDSWQACVNHCGGKPPLIASCSPADTRSHAQITRHNFDAAMPAFVEALQSCDFVAFDEEMTGLFLDKQPHSNLDDMPARYSKARD